jgi:hypothetical protein
MSAAVMAQSAVIVPSTKENDDDDDEDDGRLFYLTRASLPLIVRKFSFRMSFTQFFLNFDWPAFRAQRFFQTSRGIF